MNKLKIIALLISIGSLLSFTNKIIGTKIFSDERILYLSWNKATINSVKKNLSSVQDTAAKMSYLNRLEGLEMSLPTDDFNTIDTSIDRFKFTGIIKDELKTKKSIYVIEYYELGDMITVKNYIIYRNSKKEFCIDIYVLGTHKWIKNKETIRLKGYSEDAMTTHTTKYWGGVNKNDVIISKFENGKVNYVDFYLFKTLQSNPFIEKVLTLD
ncbi:hypothetical protein [Xanthocytophaga agilis]|uniref:Uncharacterized protein n=1 Tax=Xanthocytophaga agilis TaxID=3048010 RepID=A0AAE3R8L5_9BACT|nr:hypothetical protein [Xanthocytophaga agilis]MDJ1505250.1 hypothetical protein [Xanthocytophaga agilis]